MYTNIKQMPFHCFSYFECFLVKKIKMRENDAQLIAWSLICSSQLSRKKSIFSLLKLHSHRQ